MEANHQVSDDEFMTPQSYNLGINTTFADMSYTGGEQAHAETTTTESWAMEGPNLGSIEKTGSAEGSPTLHLNSDAETEWPSFPTSGAYQIPGPTSTFPDPRDSLEHILGQADMTMEQFVDLDILYYPHQEGFHSTSDRVTPDTETSALVSTRLDVTHPDPEIYTVDLASSADALMYSNDNPPGIALVASLEESDFTNRDGVSRESDEYHQSTNAHSNTVAGLPSFEQPVAQAMIQYPFHSEHPHMHDHQLSSLSKGSLAFPNMSYTDFNSPIPSTLASLDRLANSFGPTISKSARNSKKTENKKAAHRRPRRLPTVNRAVGPRRSTQEKLKVQDVIANSPVASSSSIQSAGDIVPTGELSLMSLRHSPSPAPGRRILELEGTSTSKQKRNSPSCPSVALNPRKPGIGGKRRLSATKEQKKDPKYQSRLFICDFPGCESQFDRKSNRDRHYKVHLKRSGQIPENDKIHCPVQDCKYWETRQQHANLRDHLFGGHKLTQCPKCGEEHGKQGMLEHLTGPNSVCKVKLCSIEKGGVTAA